MAQGPQNEFRAHAVGIDDRLCVVSCSRHRDEIRLDERHGARRLLHGHGVDEDERLVPVEELVGQVDATDAEVGHPHALRKCAIREAVGHLDPEAVVTAEDVPYAGDEHSGAHDASLPPGRGSTSSGRKKRYRPCHSSSSEAGSSSTVTAT